MSNIDHYAVFGHPINHSLSPRIHTLFAEQTGQALHYSRQDVAPEEFATALHEFLARGGQGLNCTVPLKELAYNVATHKSPQALRAKAVNTLAVRADGQLYGDNTDGRGLVRDLTSHLAVPIKNSRILLIGAGGASRGILLPLLEQSPARLTLTNRTFSRAEQLAFEFNDFPTVGVCPLEQLAGQQFDLLLNATAASLTGDIPPLPADILAPGAVCYDLAYAARPTAFVEWALRSGAALSVDGIGMLVEQAAESFLIWRGIRPDTESVIEQLRYERS